MPAAARMLALACTALVYPSSLNAATLKSMHAAVTIAGGQACEVEAAFELTSERADVVMHRLFVREPAEDASLTVTGAQAGELARFGRTIVVPVRVHAGVTRYRARYRVMMPARHRCPLLVPDAPSDGVSREVLIDVRLAPGSQHLPGEFPALEWIGDSGRATLGHVPAFIVVPHALAGMRLGWWERLETRRVVDSSAVLVIALASAVWFSRQRRRR